MTESSEVTSSRPPLMPARARVPIALVMMALLAFGTYYFIFFQRKTAYYSDRNSRMVVGLAEQLRGAIDETSRYAKLAVDVGDPTERKDLFEFDSPHRRVKMPVAVFTGVTACLPFETPRRYAENTPDGLLLHLVEQVDKDAASSDGFCIYSSTSSGCPLRPSFVSASFLLRRLVEPIIRESDADEFESVFILNSSGNVIYQHLRTGAEGSVSGVKVVRLREVIERRMLGKDQIVRTDDLVATSRQTAIRLGDADYELFSAPVQSSIRAEVDAAGNLRAADDTWVVCAIARESDFRTRSLAISVTFVSAIVAIILLLIFSWPYLKVSLIAANHRVTRIDVILLGICGILASAILSLTVLDWLTYSRLEEISDDQLLDLAREIDSNFKRE